MGAQKDNINALKERERGIKVVKERATKARARITRAIIGITKVDIGFLGKPLKKDLISIVTTTTKMLGEKNNTITGMTVVIGDATPTAMDLWEI